MIAKLMAGLAPWIEIGGEPRRASPGEFAAWWHGTDPRIMEDRFGALRVVTSFMGLPPLYETLVDDEDRPRSWATRQEACQGHVEACRELAARLLERHLRRRR